jgi:hypothetical protein
VQQEPLRLSKISLETKSELIHPNLPKRLTTLHHSNLITRITPSHLLLQIQNLGEVFRAKRAQVCIPLLVQQIMILSLSNTRLQDQAIISVHFTPEPSHLCQPNLQATVPILLVGRALRTLSLINLRGLITVAERAPMVVEGEEEGGAEGPHKNSLVEFVTFPSTPSPSLLLISTRSSTSTTQLLI